MTDKPASAEAGSRRQIRPPKVRIPGFVHDEDVGLGDAVMRATSAFGVRPCTGCQHRAAALNRWLAFSGRHPR